MTRKGIVSDPIAWRIMRRATIASRVTCRGTISWRARVSSRVSRCPIFGPASRAALLVAASSVILLFAAQLRADTKHPPPPHSVDLNSASAEELQQVPGIGPATAQAIVNFRRKSGPFQKVEDLLAIKGVSKSRLEKMRPYLTIARPAIERPAPNSR